MGESNDKAPGCCMAFYEAPGGNTAKSGHLIKDGLCVECGGAFLVPDGKYIPEGSAKLIVLLAEPTFSYNYTSTVAPNTSASIPWHQQYPPYGTTASSTYGSTAAQLQAQQLRGTFPNTVPPIYPWNEILGYFTKGGKK